MIEWEKVLYTADLHFDLDPYSDSAFRVGTYEIWYENADDQVPHSDTVLCIRGDLDIEDIEAITELCEGDYLGESEGVYRWIYKFYSEL